MGTLDQREPPTHQIDRTAIDPLDARALPRLLEWKIQLYRKLARRTHQIPALQRPDHALRKKPGFILLREALRQQPLPPALHHIPKIPAETRISQGSSAHIGPVLLVISPCTETAVKLQPK